MRVEIAGYKHLASSGAKTDQVKSTKRTRTIEIEVEKDELLVVKNQRESIRAWCDQCGAEVEMATPEAAANMAQVIPCKIYRWSESGKIHFTETQTGSLLVCLNSVS